MERRSIRPSRYRTVSREPTAQEKAHFHYYDDPRQRRYQRDSSVKVRHPVSRRKRVQNRANEEVERIRSMHNRYQRIISELYYALDTQTSVISHLKSQNRTLRKRLRNRRYPYRNQGLVYPNFEIIQEYVDPQYMQPDPDVMTYEELLALEEQIGDVECGLTQEQLHDLPMVKGEGLCTICQYDFFTNEFAIQLPCGHEYHPECVRQWLIKKKYCPLCKEEAIES